jgi:O-antigen ligase
MTLTPVYRLTLATFFLAGMWGTPLQPVLHHVAKWLMLAVLGVAAFSRPVRERVEDPIRALLVAALLGAGLLSFVGGVGSDKSLPHLLSMCVLFLVSARFAAVRSEPDARAAFLDDLYFMARLVTWTTFPMLLLDLNLGRVQGRFGGWVSNPNMLGMLLMALTPVVAARALRTPSWRPTSPRVLMAMMLVVVLATGSRGALLGAVVGGSVLAVGLGVLGRRFAAVAGVVGIALAVFGDQMLLAAQDVPALSRFVDEKMLDYATGAEGAVFDASGREVAWALAARLIDENPWTGYGWGTEEQLLAPFRDNELKAHEGALVHNSYLSLMLQIGVAGAIPMGLLLLLALRRAFGAARAAIDGDLREQAAVVLATLCGCVVHAIFESWMFASGAQISLVFWPTLFFALRSPWWTVRPRPSVPDAAYISSPRAAPAPLELPV